MKSLTVHSEFECSLVWSALSDQGTKKKKVKIMKQKTAKVSKTAKAEAFSIVSNA